MFRLVLTSIAFTGFQVLLYYYLWRRLALDTKLTRVWRRRAGWLLLGLGLTAFGTLMVARFVTPAVGRTIGWPMFIWMALLLLMISMFGLVDLVRLGIRGTRRLRPEARGIEDPGRRAFVNRMIGGGVAAGAVTLTGVGTATALKTPGVKDVPIRLDRLDASLDGFRIVQLTDLHAGNTIGRSFVEDVVARANAASPDLIAITGDLVDGTVEALADIVAPLAELRAPHGVFFVTGNHEYYAGVDPWIEHIRSLGIRVLRNERVEVAGESGFDLVGVDDHSADRWPGHGADMARAVAGRDQSRPLVVLAHQPKQVEESAKYGAGLQLSGHTHGGQIWPWHYLAMAQQGGLLAGHSRHGETQLYISRGTGHWGPPVRVFAPAEITRVILRSTEPNS
jgi:predicted MPP superfamily phosphohydrolase